MVWLTLGLTTLLGLLLVWIATQENRSARILGAGAVLVHTLMLIGGAGLEPTSIWITVAGVIAIASQAAVLGVVTVWIGTRQSRVGRVIGGLILAVLTMALTYGMVFGPMWKTNVLIVATPGSLDARNASWCARLEGWRPRQEPRLVGGCA